MIMANTKTIDNCIFWQEHVRDTTRDPAQRARCNAAIEKLMSERRELVRYHEEQARDQGARDQRNWYATDAELR
jgi:hypothetical protein